MVLKALARYLTIAWSNRTIIFRELTKRIHRRN